jgi:hypothetical protein
MRKHRKPDLAVWFSLATIFILFLAWVWFIYLPDGAFSAPQDAPAGFGRFNPTPQGNSGGEAFDEVHGIRVVGSERFKREVREAMDVLKEGDIEGYNLVQEYVRKIEMRRIRGMAESFSDGTVVFDPNYTDSTIGRAGAMVHEAMHIYLYRHGLPYSGEEGEEACIRRQTEAINRLMSNQ